jgi:hypothetical protein
MAAPQCVGSMDSKGMQFAKQQLEKFGWKEGNSIKNGVFVKGLLFCIVQAADWADITAALQQP